MTPWVSRLIVANIVVFFLAKRRRGGSPVRVRPGVLPVSAVDDRDVHVPARPERHHAHPVQHARPVLLRAAGRGAAGVEAFHRALPGQRHLRRGVLGRSSRPTRRSSARRPPCSASCSRSRTTGLDVQILHLLLPPARGALRGDAHGGDGALERFQRLARRRGRLRAPWRLRRRLALPQVVRVRLRAKKFRSKAVAPVGEGRAARTRSASTPRRSTKSIATK